MRLPLAPILTIFTLLGAVLATPANLAQHRAPSANSSSDSSSQTSSSSSSSTSTSSSSSTTTTTTISSSSSSSSQTFTPTTPTPTPSQSSSSTRANTSPSTIIQQPSSSTASISSASSSQSTHSTSSSSTLALSDLTNTGLSFPTAFTSTFASIGSDGSSFTVTAVVSRPTGVSGSDATSTAKQGFFANTGAVAGTFLVVGLVGTGIIICVFLWALRRYRRRKSDQAYFDEEYKEFNHQGDRTITPEPTLPVTRDSAFAAPVPSSPAPNMIERLHGNEAAASNVYYDRGQYQAQPGEFDPYQAHDGAYAYSDDHANYAQYGQYPENGQQDTTAYAYQPEIEPNTAVPGQHQAVAGPSHVPQDSMDSFYQIDPTRYQGAQAQ